MAEYSLGFSESLIAAGELLFQNSQDSVDKKRTVLYLSLLSSEISLKAILERAGIPVANIKALSHHLDALMHLVDQCEVPFKESASTTRWIPATSINAKSFSVEGQTSTAGIFLMGEKEGASKYPNEIRYGEHIRHFPPEAALAAAKVIFSWVQEHWDVIRINEKFAK